MSAVSPRPEKDPQNPSSSVTPKSSEKKKPQQQQGQINYYDPAEFLIRKRLSAHWPKRHCDVFVSNQTDIKAQKKRCLALFAEGESTIYLHSLGSAIPRALTLALALQREVGGEERATLDIQTETVELTDDFEPVRSEQGEGHTHSATRLNSAVHLKLSVLPPPPSREQ